MGVVYHANYLIWMEVARVEFCTALGFRYRDMERDEGLLLAVVEANCRYLRPARFDDEIAVGIAVEESNARMVRFGYEMRQAETDEVVATGFTKHLWLQKDMTVVRLPEKYRGLFQAR